MAKLQPLGADPSILYAAHFYAARGFAVAPFHTMTPTGCTCKQGRDCDAAANHPRIKGWKEAATTSHEIIDEWVEKFRQLNLAVLTGARSGIVVLDFDGEEGSWTKAELEKAYGEFARTPTVRSGGGGLHLWFRHPGGDYVIPTGDGILGPKMDLKADNGHVTVPPSRHRSGQLYEWEIDLDVPLAPLPAWIGPAARRAKETGKSLIATRMNGEPYQYRRQGSNEKYELPARIPSGKRGDELFRYAASLRAKGFDETKIEDALRDARDTRCDDPISISDGELSSIAKSACKYPAGTGGMTTATRSTTHLSRPLPTEKVWEREPEFVPGIDDPEAWAAGHPVPIEAEPDHPDGATVIEMPSPMRRIEGPMPPEPPDFDDVPPPKKRAPARNDDHDDGDGDGGGGGGGGDGVGGGDGGGDDEDPRLCNAGPDGFAQTELGNAERCFARFGGDVRYVTTNKEWMVYTGAHWKVDDREEVRRWAQSTARSLHPLYLEAHNEKAQKAWAGHVKSFESKNGIYAALGLMQSFPEVVRTAYDLDDGAENLLCCPNGLVDLRSGALLPPARDPMITRITKVRFDMEAACPTFTRFLHQIFGGNQELIRFIQRAIGYSLTGRTDEQCLFFCYGQGRNGKSTLVNLIRDVVGSYGTHSSFDTFLARTNDNARADLAMLKGSRMVTASEPEAAKDFSEAVIKQVTGGDNVTCRKLYGQYFTYTPEFKLWLAANHKPRIRNQDDGIWRRFRMIPFEVQIPDNEKDGALPAKLRAEAAGVLAWAVRGAMDWYEDGLQAPSIVIEATQEYREEMDVIGDFVAEAIYERDDPDEWGERVRAVYMAYQVWCDKNREKPLGKKRFNQQLEEHGHKKQKRAKDGQQWWKGIGLRHDFASE